MRVVIAPDKFKGSLSAADVGDALRSGILEVQPEADLSVVAMADGGEGTLDAALANGFDRLEATVTGPLGSPVTAAVALQASTAVVEMAAASGLALVPPETRDALAASSRGTGELIRAALDAGAETIVLAIGGSASTDGGAGMLAALGARFLDDAGTELPDGGGALSSIAEADLSGLDPRIARTRFILASDVDNPLLGPQGAAAVFAPQKGASPADVAQLELALTAYARAVRIGSGDAADTASPPPETRPGAGAAGGLGFAAIAALGAQQRPGVDVVIEFTRLRAHLAGADFVITGEGSLDEQSLGGKTPVGVARAAATLGVPAIAVCGRTTLAEPAWRAAGFAQCFATLDRAPDAASSSRDAARYLSDIGRDIALAATGTHV